ncbi:MAG: Ig-like domain-containing protein [Paracoccaceae bacterium]
MGTVEAVLPVALSVEALRAPSGLAPFDLTGTGDTPLALTLDPADFTDVDGDALTIDLRSEGGGALPTWLSFDPTTLDLTGTPPADFHGDVALEAVADDGTVETVLPVTLTIDPVNDAPVANADSFDAGDALTFTILAADLLANDTDVDGPALSIASVTGTTGVAATLNGDGDIEVVRDRALDGQFTISYELSDGTLSDTADVLIDLTRVNEAPVIAEFGPLTADEDTGFDLAIPAGTITDPDGDALTVSVIQGDGSVLPAWLSFDAVNQRLSGTPPANFFGTLPLLLTATDGFDTTSRAFELAINPVNDAPVLLAPLPDVTATEDTLIDLQLAQGIYADPDGDPLTYELRTADGGTIPPWLSFDPVELRLQGQPPQDFFGDVELQLVLSDGVTETVEGFTLTVENTPDAPVVATDLPDLSTDDSGAALVEGTPFAITVPEESFVDPDGDPLTLTATLADGAPLPAWLSFDGTAFTGTAPSGAASAPIALRLQASDGNNTVSDVFELTFEASTSNAAPDARDDAFTARVPTPLVLGADDLLANDVDPDGDTLEITSVGAAQNGTVTFEDGAIKYVADFNHRGADQFTYTVSDGQETDTATVTVDVVNRFDTVSQGGDRSELFFGSRGNDLAFGGGGNDWMFGGRGDDYLDGGAGNDVLFGGRGDDTLHGGSGNDVIFAGRGKDVIVGGEGNDILFGGRGQDTFRFEQGDGVDVIFGFDTPRGRRRRKPGDLLEISANGIDDFADLMANATQTRGGVLLDLGGGDGIFLAGTRLASLDEDQFTFY